MASLDALIEAERRGILPPEKVAALNELRKRGTVDDSAFLPSAPDPTQPLQLGDQTLPPLAANVPMAGEADMRPPSSPLRTVIDNFNQGQTFGFADEITNPLGVTLATLVKDPMAIIRGDYKDGGFAEDISNVNQTQSDRLNRQMADSPVTAIASQLGGGLTTGGAGVSTKGGSALATGIGRGLLPEATGILGRTGNLATKAALSGATGAASGALLGAGSAEEGMREQGAIEGAGTGTLAGAALPVAGAALSGAAQAIVPRIDEAIQPLAARARELGIPLRADQISPTFARNTLQKVSQEIPLSGANKFQEGQRQSFNAAVAKTIGQDAKDLSPEVVNKFLDDASEKFGGAIKGKVVSFVPEDSTAIQGIVNASLDDVSSDVSAIVSRNAEKILKDLSGDVKGEKLSSVRSDLIKRLPKIDSQARPYISEMIDVIDDAVQRSVPESVDTLKQARREWRNYKTLQPLLEKSTDGNINPTDLLQRVAANPYINASRTPTGQDELVDLARIGKTFLAKKGGSDTFQKVGLGAGGLSVLSNPATLAPIAGGVGLNRAIQSGLNTNQKIIDLAIKNSGKPKVSAMERIADFGRKIEKPKPIKE